MVVAAVVVVSERRAAHDTGHRDMVILLRQSVAVSVNEAHMALSTVAVVVVTVVVGVVVVVVVGANVVVIKPPH